MDAVADKPWRINRDRAYVREDLVEVGDSALHGRGLFARETIAAGTELGICRAKKARDLEGPHVLWLGEDEVPVRVKCTLRFINHSASPNVVYYDDLSVVALRDIGAGEELLHHYGDEWE